MSCNVTELADGIKVVFRKAIKKVTSTANAIRTKYVSKESPPSTVTETETETNLPAAASSPPFRQRGTVKEYESYRGIGWITPDDGSLDAFVHINSVTMAGFKWLKVGQKVEYDALEIKNQMPHAINVTLVQ